MKKKKKIEKLKAEIVRLKESIEFRDKFIWENKLVLPGDIPPLSWDTPYEERFHTYFGRLPDPDENGNIIIGFFDNLPREGNSNPIDMCGSIDRSEKSKDS